MSAERQNQGGPVEYKVDDQELLLGFYKAVLWNRMVPRIPRAITPNTITIVGQIMGLLAVVFAWLAVSGHPVGYLLSALSLLTYLTFDNIDGAHARRTGRCSPLGEFLDHGLDGVASGAVLLTTGLVLRVDPIPLVLLCVLGAVGFSMVFWEQYRTGHLVIPKVSSTEGVTFLILIQLALLIFGDPATLNFSESGFNVAHAIVVIVLVGYAAALAPPIVRAAQHGVRPWELIPLALVAGSFAVYPVMGGHPIIPAVAVGMLGADVVCRMIVKRHRRQWSAITSRLHVLVVLPAIGAVAAPNAWTVNGWSALALIIVSALYSRTLFRGVSEMLARGNARATAAVS